MTDATLIAFILVLIPLLVIAIIVMSLRLRAAVKRDQQNDNQQ
ncbi:hypothetical protein [Amylibacter sp. IMCC11727]|mgnify:CR=1 FL=1|nr:hypothetical protein [Amylibacter sp. IMCC11727]WGI20556.1 hypothetical protein QBD29_10550 [Amylibacter sp. IMCC11727]